MAIKHLPKVKPGFTQGSEADETVAYIRQMLKELHKAAADVDWYLAYLTEMALLDAGDILAGLRPMKRDRG
ncbi:hypothetical protein [Sinorhizobium sp. RAC02]|uniref:hypothetical protein n=1 Tax=Sinorhizobium sp. RAC02 TaxID=1842534 RepID=UPI00083D888A|nr:hypothetical protein [Sinorhizobium sp. RAC02]AOF88308.1 hypothetical protein BSY16_1613 [Sinorhizobium sp. RAC02]